MDRPESPSDGTDRGRVLVIGAGIAGIRAALDLAESGYEVLLTETSDAIGGILSKLDVQFPTDHCGMCRMLPFVGRESSSQFCMRKGLFHDDITILPGTEVVAAEGEPGRFSVTLRHRARWVDTEVCIGDGACAEVCPVEVPSEFDEGITTRKAAYRPVPSNLPNLYVIDRDACTRCGECVAVCPTGAIDLDAEDREETVEVGAVVVATGTGLADPRDDLNVYAYGENPHVLTSLTFERLVGVLGPHGGELRRPHDGKPAKRIAWLHCVGSRDRRRGRDYCSSACCMFALKEAVLALEHGGPETEATLFYMDLRTYGRDYYRYRERAEAEGGLRLVRCRAHSVRTDADGDPVLRWFDAEGRPREESFDLVVLATGQRPPRELEPLAEIFGFDRDEHGFASADAGDGVTTSRPGVFACGAVTGLKDIHDALVQAGAAAATAGALLRRAGFPAATKTRAPAERPADRLVPSTLVVLCRWPLTEGAWTIDFDRLAERCRGLFGVNDVAVVEEICRGGSEEVRELLARPGANRIVFGACLPFVYRRRLREMAEVAGHNSSLVDVVDLRGAARRAHRAENGHDPEGEAFSVVRRSVQALAARDPVHVTRVPVTRRALVIGGGPAGMRAALTLAGHGVPVTLVEKRGELGGQAARLSAALAAADPRGRVAAMAAEIYADEVIDVLTGAEVVAHRGRVGAFSSLVRVEGREDLVPMAHGITVVATGGSEAPTEEYGHGADDRVVTQGELEEAFAAGRLGAEDLGRVVMIQCVGSREPGGREYCSRICCATALKNALRIIEIRPDARILVLYRDMMAYGDLERHYTRARERGVLFATYDPALRPEVATGGDEVVVRYRDEVLGADVEFGADLVVLATGVVPANTEDLARTLGIERTEDGFLREADYKFRPVETLKEGIYVCGLANSPRSIDESLVMAEAAAGRALSVLAREELTSARLVSAVRRSLCTACRQCVTLCPYQARSVDEREGRVVVDELACQGCGICVAACPSGAASFKGSTEREVIAVLEAELGALP